MTRPKVESRVGRMLQEFDPGMYLDYSRKTIRFHNKLDKMTDELPFVNNATWEVSEGKKIPVFYMEFNEPVYIVLNNPLSRFRRLSNRRVGTKEGGYFYRYGLVPVYFASMNTMSVLKLYQGRAGKVFDPSSRFFGDIRCIELGHKKGSGHTNPVKFSSLNIIEQGVAKEFHVDKRISDWFYNQYFTYGFWLQPRKGFVPATHMEFGTKINAVFKLAKSIYVVDHRGPKKDVTVAGKEITVYDVDVRGVKVDSMEFRERFKARIEAGILDELTEKDPRKLPLLNGILMEIRDKDGMKDKNFEKILTVNASYGRSYQDIIRVAIGMYCSRACSEYDAVSRLHDVDTFKSRAKEYCEKWMKELAVDPTPESGSDEVFNAAMDDMFPMLVADESSVYFTNPIIIGFLKKWNMITDSTESQKSILLLLLSVLEKISNICWKDRRSISRDDEYRELAKLVNNDSRFASSLIRLVSEIKLSNLIQSSYQVDFSEEWEQE